MGEGRRQGADHDEQQVRRMPAPGPCPSHPPLRPASARATSPCPLHSGRPGAVAGLEGQPRPACTASAACARRVPRPAAAAAAAAAGAAAAGAAAADPAAPPAPGGACVRAPQPPAWPLCRAPRMAGGGALLQRSAGAAASTARVLGAVRAPRHCAGICVCACECACVRVRVRVCVSE